MLPCSLVWQGETVYETKTYAGGGHQDWHLVAASFLFGI